MEYLSQNKSILKFEKFLIATTSDRLEKTSDRLSTSDRLTNDFGPTCEQGFVNFGKISRNVGPTEN